MNTHANIAEQLRNLRQLHQSGELTDDQFAQAEQAALVIEGVVSEFCNVMGQGTVDGRKFEFDGSDGHWSFVVWEEESREDYWLEGDWDQQDRLDSRGDWEQDLKAAEAIIRRCAAQYRRARLA